MRPLALWLLTTALAASQPVPAWIQPLLPKGARVIDTADISTKVHKPRLMVFWMDNPKRIDEGESSYCGSWVNGQIFWEGPGRLSLIDMREHKMINTVRIAPVFEDSPSDSLKIPIAYRKLDSSGAYQLRHAGANGEGDAAVLELADLTSNGVGADFILIQYESCNSWPTSVLGYQPQTDRVVQYPIEEQLRHPPKILPHFWMRNLTHGDAAGKLGSVLRATGPIIDGWYLGQAEFDTSRQLFSFRSIFVPMSLPIP